MDQNRRGVDKGKAPQRSIRFVSPRTTDKAPKLGDLKSIRTRTICSRRFSFLSPTFPSSSSLPLTSLPPIAPSLHSTYLCPCQPLLCRLENVIRLLSVLRATKHQDQHKPSKYNGNISGSKFPRISVATISTLKMTTQYTTPRKRTSFKARTSITLQQARRTRRLTYQVARSTRRWPGAKRDSLPFLHRLCLQDIRIPQVCKTRPGAEKGSASSRSSLQDIAIAPASRTTITPMPLSQSMSLGLILRFILTLSSQGRSTRSDSTIKTAKTSRYARRWIGTRWDSCPLLHHLCPQDLQTFKNARHTRRQESDPRYQD